MPGKRGSKQKQGGGLPESSGVSQTTAELDHAFAASDTGKKKHRWAQKLTRRQWLVAGIILIALIGGSAYAVWQNRSEQEPEKRTLTSEGVELRKLNNEQLRDELQKLIFQKKFKSAEELINYQDDAKSDELRLLLALTYQNQNKLQDALRVLKDLERRDQNNWQLANTIGDVYQQLGDKQDALTYYKKALELLKKTDDSPVQADDVHFLEQTISTLEAQP